VRGHTCDHPRVRALALVALVACGHAANPQLPAHTSAFVAAFPALRWVPPHATYVLAAHKTSDAVAAMRELALVVGVAADFDITDAQDDLRKETGVDFLSIDGLKEVGVDPDGGIAIFSEGLSPTLAIELGDPQRTAGFIEEHRTGSVAVEVQREAGVDVYTFAGDREVHLHWAIADGWLFVHLEFTMEREPELAWYKDARAAGGAFDPGSIDPRTPVLAIADVGAMRTHLARAGAPRACLDVFAPVHRASMSAGVDGKDATASITLELDGNAAASTLAPPPGWAKARQGAAIAAEWNLDLDRVAKLGAACELELPSMPVRAGGLFVHTLDLDKLEGTGAAWAAARDPRMFDELLDQIPGLSLGSHKRTVGGVTVVDVSMPMIPSFSYVKSATLIMVASGGGLIDALLTGAPPKTTTLAHVELRPWALPDDVWDQLLRYGLHVDSDTNRKQWIRRIHRWDSGSIDLEAKPGALVLTARGRVH